MDWIQVIVNLILTGILLYVFQRVIDERSERRLEKFKVELRSTAFEQETKFSKLHEIRSTVIAELYKKLFRFREALSSLKLFLEDPDFYVDIIVDQKLTEAYDAEEEFRMYFQANRLYIPERICNQVDYIYIQFSGAIKFFSDISFNMHMIKISKGEAVKYLEKNKGVLSAALVLNEQIDPLLKQLENDFRNLLGS